jgi:hypothetical protein
LLVVQFVQLAARTSGGRYWDRSRVVVVAVMCMVISEEAISG